jgi:hypothetical protein
LSAGNKKLILQLDSAIPASSMQHHASFPPFPEEQQKANNIQQHHQDEIWTLRVQQYT